MHEIPFKDSKAILPEGEFKHFQAVQTRVELITLFQYSLCVLRNLSIPQNQYSDIIQKACEKFRPNKGWPSKAIFIAAGQLFQ
jgi:hypothetical protein